MEKDDNSKSSLDNVHCKTEREDGVTILPVVDEYLRPQSLKGSTEEIVPLKIEVNRVKKEDISSFFEDNVIYKPEIEEEVGTLSVKVEDGFCKDEFGESDNLEVDESSQDKERRGFRERQLDSTTLGRQTMSGHKEEVEEGAEGFTVSLLRETVRGGKRKITYQVSPKKDVHCHNDKKRYQCDICSKSFVEKCNLKSHKFVHTSEKPFKCKMCSKSFADSPRLRRHEKTHEPKSDRAEEKPFKCDVCLKSFSTAYFFVTHKRMHTGEKPFECKLCPSSFYSSSYLKRHEMIHTGEKPYQCEICFKSFNRNCDLTSHKWVHTSTEEKPFKCEVCLKTFCALSRLKVHEKIHTEENPFTCKICSKSFPMAYYLKAHQWSHVEEKPFKCDICSRTFTVNSRLIVHRRTHTGEKPFKCKLCPKTFSIRSNCRKHERTHRGEQGNQPESEVFDSDQKHVSSDDMKILFTGYSSEDANLRKRKFDQAEEKSFKCEYCSKSFSVNSRLIAHRRIHTGEKPFQCKICSRSFSMKANCKKHEETHRKVSESAAKKSNVEKHEISNDKGSDEEYDKKNKEEPSGEFIWSGETKIFVMGDGSEEIKDVMTGIKEELLMGEEIGDTTNENEQVMADIN